MTFDFSHTKFSFSRPISSYSKVQQAYSRLIRNQGSQLTRPCFKMKPFLNIGCGDRPHRDFVNIDYNWIPGIDLCWDISQSLPFESESIQGIFTEHCLEHLSLQHAQYFLAEAWRILKLGGRIRIVVPDAEIYINTYLDWRKGQKHIFPSGEGPTTSLFSPIMAVNNIFRNYGHKYAYDFDCMRLLLENCDFSEVARCHFMDGLDPLLLIDTESRRHESLYVEAVKLFHV
jgi:predicted SAM-dependent methyltransferase